MQYWSTSGLPAGEQFSYWREVVCQAFTPLAPNRTDAHRSSGAPDPGLTSWVRSSLLTSTNCAEVSSRSQLLSHGQAEVSRIESEDVFVNLQVRGHCVVTQDGRTSTVPAGSFHLVDATRQFRQDYIEDPATQDWRVVSFRVARAHLVPLLSRPDAFTAVAHDARSGGVNGVAASTMLAVWKNIDRLDRSAADAAESAVNTILAAATGGSDRMRDTSRQAIDASLKASINRYVAANLRGSPDLSAPAVAHRFGISVRKLHGLYEGSGRSYAKSVMALRVAACARQLRADGTRCSITELAARWGFSDLSHMNRVFRSHYGCLPSEFREGAEPIPADLLTVD